MSGKRKRIEDLSLVELLRGLETAVKSLGPNCGTARVYRRVLAEKEQAAIRNERRRRD